MPFTPFHMGVALIVKPGFNRHFSVMTFGVAQIAMDIEPGVGMLTGADVLHGPTHTILGALVIACLVMLVGRGICSYLLRNWNREVSHYGLHRLVQPETVSKTALMSGAFIGTLSHVALDSLIHHDIHPLLPFSRANPLLGLITHDAVYELCAIAAVLGTVAWLALRWAGQTTQSASMSNASVIGTQHRLWALWVRELRWTWFWTLLLSVAPALTYGTGFFSMGVLMVAVVIGVPLLVIHRIFSKNSAMNGARKLAVMVLVPIVSLIHVFEVDKQVPVKAAPITKAIESFHLETGHYPDSLELLTPKHLSRLPDLRPSLIQPRITYRVTDGKPYLAVPSAAGDAFAKYEYNFETKIWEHQS